MGDVHGKLIARRVKLTDTPTLISESGTGRCSILIKNLTAARAYIGGDSSVSPITGFPLELYENMTVGISQRSFQISGFNSVYVYGVCDTGLTTEVAVFEESKVVQRLPS